MTDFGVKSTDKTWGFNEFGSPASTVGTATKTVQGWTGLSLDSMYFCLLYGHILVQKRRYDSTPGTAGYLLVVWLENVDIIDGIQNSPQPIYLGMCQNRRKASINRRFLDLS